MELPLKHRKKRIDLEARGLIKGAQVVYLGPGNRAGFAELHVDRRRRAALSAASIIKIEKPDEEEPFIPAAATHGGGLSAWLGGDDPQGAGQPVARGAGLCPRPLGCGASWPIRGRDLPLWKRLAYVAITRAEERLHWVVRNRLGPPQKPLGVEDLRPIAAPLTLSAEE